MSAEASSSASSSNGCPVPHDQRHAFIKKATPGSSEVNAPLSSERVISSIPRLQEGAGNWVYPSQAQFYKALQRKEHDPAAVDMSTVVPIHNAVNERAWRDILSWEREVGAGDSRLDDVKLVSFLGKPGEPSPRARLKTLMGCAAIYPQRSNCPSTNAHSYSAPFDRHDWLVDRNGTRIRYVIDFYTGYSARGNVSFYLDARPALDSFEGIRMRCLRLMQRIWRGRHVEEVRRQEFERMRTTVALATTSAVVQEREV